jgi:hypothetical protein
VVNAMHLYRFDDPVFPFIYILLSQNPQKIPISLSINQFIV